MGNRGWRAKTLKFTFASCGRRLDDRRALLRAARRQVFEVLNVDMHVPEARGQKCAVGVDYAALRRGGGVEGSHGNNVIAPEDYGLIGQFFSGGDVHDGDVTDRCRLPGGILRGLERGRD